MRPSRLLPIQLDAWGTIGRVGFQRTTEPRDLTEALNYRVKIARVTEVNESSRVNDFRNFFLHTSEGNGKQMVTHHQYVLAIIRSNIYIAGCRKKGCVRLEITSGKSSIKTVFTFGPTSLVALPIINTCSGWLFDLVNSEAKSMEVKSKSSFKTPFHKPLYG